MHGDGSKLFYPSLTSLAPTFENFLVNVISYISLQDQMYVRVPKISDIEIDLKSWISRPVEVRVIQLHHILLRRAPCDTWKHFPGLGAPRGSRQSSISSKSGADHFGWLHPDQNRARKWRNKQIPTNKLSLIFLYRSQLCSHQFSARSGVSRKNDFN